MTDFERKITSEKALDAAIRQLKIQDDWFLTTKTGLAKRIVTLYDEIIAAADFPVSLPVRDVLNYSSAAFMNYVKLGCNYITRKFNVRHSPTTVYSYGYNYSNEAIHEKASYPYTIDDFFADPLRKSLFVIGCYNYLHDVIDGKIKPTKMTEAKAETKPLTLQSATTRTHHSHHQNEHRFLFRHQNLRCLQTRAPESRKTVTQAQNPCPFQTPDAPPSYISIFIFIYKRY